MSDLIAASLAETIRALRSELTSAMESGAGERLHFQLGAVQLEVALAITRECVGDAGIRFGVVSFGAKGSLRDAETHRLSLSLQPVVKDGNGQTQHAVIAGISNSEPR